MNSDSLARFDLHFPGRWIGGSNRDWAFEVYRVLGLVEGLFVEAVAAYALFQPMTRETALEYIRGNKEETPYERCLNSIYAKAFVFSLHTIGKLLQGLSKDPNRPSAIEELYREYMHHFGHLKHVRDSAMHIENRGLGRDRYDQPIDTRLLVIGCFIENRYTFTGEDGKQYEMEISDRPLKIAQGIIQKIISAYAWE